MVIFQHIRPSVGVSQHTIYYFSTVKPFVSGSIRQNLTSSRESEFQQKATAGFVSTSDNPPSENFSQSLPL